MRSEDRAEVFASHLALLREAWAGRPLAGGDRLYPSSPRLLDRIWQATFSIAGGARAGAAGDGLMLSRTQPRSEAAPKASLADLQRPIIDAYLETRPRHVAGVVPYVLIRSGETGRGLRLMQQAPTTNDALLMSEMFGDRTMSAITAPEFTEFARKSGLAALWDVHGAPDRCRKQPSGDYTCK